MNIRTDINSLSSQLDGKAYKILSKIKKYEYVK